MLRAPNTNIDYGSWGERVVTSEAVSLQQTLISRRDLLACLDHEAATKPEIVERCAISRSTVDRGLNRLQREGVVARGSKGRYELTLFGTIVLRDVERMLDRLDRLVTVRDQLATLDEASDPDPAFFQDARVTHADGLGVEEAISAFGDATSVRLLNPPFPLLFMGLRSDATADDWPEIDVYLRHEVMADVLNANPQFGATIAATGMRLYEVDSVPPFSIALLEHPDSPPASLVFVDSSEGTAVIEARTPEAVEWGESLFDRATADAEPVPTTQ